MGSRVHRPVRDVVGDTAIGTAASHRAGCGAPRRIRAKPGEAARRHRDYEQTREHERATSGHDSHAFRIRSSAILLFGGDKSGKWNAWYDKAIPIADDLFDDHIQTLADEGLI